jgi:acyl-CoA synthetase
VLFTGGEAIPRHKALEFERRTGAVLLNMYGSNETGVQSYTTLRDTDERRLASAGKVIDEVEVRLFDAAGQETHRSAGPGRPASRGEVCSLGYYDDGAANEQLFTPDGWMLMGDLVTIDDEGYLRVVGRTSDFIIRGGKNISAVAVEEEVGTHPGVLRCAVVAMPDPVFGERVCVYVVARPGTVLELAGVVAHLQERGVSREWFPERLVLLDALPTSDGGKVAKAALRADLEQRMRQGRSATT